MSAAVRLAAPPAEPPAPPSKSVALATVVALLAVPVRAVDAANVNAEPAPEGPGWSRRDLGLRLARASGASDLAIATVKGWYRDPFNQSHTALWWSHAAANVVTR